MQWRQNDPLVHSGVVDVVQIGSPDEYLVETVGVIIVFELAEG